MLKKKIKRKIHSPKHQKKHQAQELKKPYQNFEDTFKILLEKAKAGSVSISDLLTSLSGRGKVLLLIFMSLGFGQIPVVSTFLGLVIVYLGIRIAMGHSFIWMPRSFLHKKIPSYFLVKVINQSLLFLKYMKKWSHPRFTWTVQQNMIRVLNGIMIALVGMFFALAPPIPLAGLIAFIAIFLIAIGILNDDGIYMFLGYCFSVIYFAIILCLLKFCSLQKMFEWIKAGWHYFSLS